MIITPERAKYLSYQFSRGAKSGEKVFITGLWNKLTYPEFDYEARTLDGKSGAVREDEIEMNLHESFVMAVDRLELFINSLH
jgi:hypothetical protein